MSQEVADIYGPTPGSRCKVVSFYGGAERGRCLQLSQATYSAVGIRIQQVSLTEEQVREAIVSMQEWLDQNNS